MLQGNFLHLVYDFTAIFNTSANFRGKVFVTNACLCRRKCVAVLCDASAFTNAPKLEFHPNMTGALSKQITATIFQQRSLFLKKLSTDFVTFPALVIVVRGWENTDTASWFTHLDYTYKPLHIFMFSEGLLIGKHSFQNKAMYRNNCSFQGTLPKSSENH